VKTLSDYLKEANFKKWPKETNRKFVTLLLSLLPQPIVVGEYKCNFSKDPLIWKSPEGSIIKLHDLSELEEYLDFHVAEEWRLLFDEYISNPEELQHVITHLIDIGVI
jgi:hypothetical protein